MNTGWTAAVNSTKMIQIKHEIQDVFASNGMIMMAKWCLQDQTYKYMYLYNKYASVGSLLYFPEDLDQELFIAKQRFEQRYPRDEDSIQDNMFLCSWTKANYFQWCSVIHERDEWLDNPLFEDWANKYRLYKLDKLYSK